MHMTGNSPNPTSFEKLPNPTDASTIGLMEVKKYAQRWLCTDDVNRLRGLRRKIDSVKVCFLVTHLQYSTSDDLNNAIKTMLKDCEIKLNNAAVKEFKGRDGYCASVVAEV